MDTTFDFNQVKALLRGANVAIVGNAPRILNQNHGREIDSHDVIIRMNKGYPDVNYDALGYKTTFASSWGPDCDPDRFPNKKWYFVLNDTKENPYYGINPEKITAVLYNPKLGLSKLYKLPNASSGCIWAITAIESGARNIDCYGRDRTTCHNFSDIGIDKSAYFHHNFANEEDFIIDYAKSMSVKLNMIFE